MNVFHYTVLGNLKLIMASELRPSILDYSTEFSSRPILWFSRQTTYEPTAVKGISALGKVPEDFEEQCKYYTAARITVPEESAPITWRQFLKTSGIKSKCAKALEDTALTMGSNVNYFRDSYAPIRCDKFSAVEVWSKNQWVPYTGNEPLTVWDKAIIKATQSEIEQAQKCMDAERKSSGVSGPS